MRKIFTLLFLSVALHGAGQLSPYGDIIRNDILFDSVNNTLRQGCGGICGTIQRSGKVVGPNVVQEISDTGKVVIINCWKPKPVDTTRKVTMRCLRVLTGNSQPLIVIDGIPQKPNKLSRLNPDDIDSIWILRSAVASALYGYEGANGAIAITTKKNSKFIIRDFSDGSPIAGATVLFTSLNDRHEKLQFIANDSGIVIINKLNRPTRYQMTVSAVGHITTEQVFESNAGKGKEIFLNRDVVSCDEVLLSYIACPRRTINNWLNCGVSGITITNDPDKKGQSFARRLELNAYPNPAQRGGSLNLQFNNEDGIRKLARIISLDGKPLQQEILPANKGLTNFRITTDARWAAGLYFIQVTYENGKVLASEKIIIQ